MPSYRIVDCRILKLRETQAVPVTCAFSAKRQVDSETT